MLKQMKEMIQTDLNNINVLLEGKKKDFLKITSLLAIVDVELDEMSEKLIINCDLDLDENGHPTEE